MNHTGIADGFCPFFSTVCRNSKHFNGDIRIDGVTLGTRRLWLRQLLTTNNLQMQPTTFTIRHVHLTYLDILKQTQLLM